MSSVHEKALRVSYFSAAYHILEGVVSVLAGISASSIALLGFGLDSFVETLSGLVVIWRLSKHGKMTKQEEARTEKKSLRLIAYTFFILSVYVFYEAVKRLYFHQIPQQSLFGILIAVISLIVMPVLFFLKRKIGKSIKMHSMVADAKQQLACISLSVALLIGLGLNYVYGLWEADPFMGIIISVYLVKEGFSTLKEQRMCNC